MTPERIGALVIATDAFKQQQAGRGRQIPEESLEHGTFWPSQLEMLEDLVIKYELMDSGKRILDVGTGNAFAALILAAVTGAQIASIEIHPERYQYVVDLVTFLRTERGLSYPNLTISKEDFLEHPITDYDVVYFYYTFPRDRRSEFIREILAKLSRELKPGAVFISPMLGSEKGAVEENIIQGYLDSHHELTQEKVLIGGIFTCVIRKSNAMSPTSPATGETPAARPTNAAVSAEADSGKGGIDFHGLPIVTQPAPQAPLPAQRLTVNGPRLTQGVADLQGEWQQIQRMLQAKIIPSNQRLKEYLMSVCSNENCQRELDKVLACIADILRIEEERCYGTEAALKEMLVLLESGKPAQQMRLALAQIQVEEKEPAVIGQ
jgi:SAM-dependent methyltransferase